MKILPAVILISGLALAACQQSTETEAQNATETSAPAATATGVSNLTLRLNANAEAPSAVYFAFNGGPTGGAITGVSSPDAARVEMHETRMDGGLMTMVPVERIEAAAGHTIAPRERGLHLMLFGLSDAARTAQKVRLVFRMADGSELTAETSGLAEATDAAAHATPAEHSGH